MKPLCAALLLGTAALLLSGCGTIREAQENYQSSYKVNIENVVGNVWKIEAQWPAGTNTARLAEALHERARQHCSREHMGMLPISGTSDAGDEATGKQAHATLEFRCQAGAKVEQKEYQGIILHLDEFIEDDDDPKSRRRRKGTSLDDFGS